MCSFCATLYECFFFVYSAQHQHTCKHCLMMHVCLARPVPPNLTISKQNEQSPQSLRWQASHFLHRVRLLLGPPPPWFAPPLPPARCFPCLLPGGKGELRLPEFLVRGRRPPRCLGWKGEKFSWRRKRWNVKQNTSETAESEMLLLIQIESYNFSYFLQQVNLRVNVKTNSFWFYAVVCSVHDPLCNSVISMNTGSIRPHDIK